MTCEKRAVCAAWRTPGSAGLVDSYMADTPPTSPSSSFGAKAVDFQTERSVDQHGWTCIWLDCPSRHHLIIGYDLACRGFPIFTPRRKYPRRAQSLHTSSHDAVRGLHI